MKTILTTMLCLFYLISSGSDTLFVESKSDKRLIAYQDSLKKWRANERQKAKEKKLFGTATDLKSHLAIAKQLGYRDAGGCPITPDGRKMFDSQEKKFIKYERLCCSDAKWGQVSCYFFPIVTKPKRPVVYRLVRTKKVTTVSIDSNGNQTIEKTQTTVFITK